MVIKIQGLHFPYYASFFKASFARLADFDDAPTGPVRFSARPTFTSTQFRGDALFRKCNFESGALFNGTEFDGLAGFAWARFGAGSPERLVEFRQVKFRGLADLYFVCADLAEGVAFRYCDLSGLKISSIRRDRMKNIEFEEITNWKLRRGLFLATFLLATIALTACLTNCVSFSSDAICLS
jgi:hypothetical protein